jgi:hypothetical protein
MDLDGSVPAGGGRGSKREIVEVLGRIGVRRSVGNDLRQNEQETNPAREAMVVDG